MPQVPQQPIDLEQLAREILDGVVGDEPAPFVTQEAARAAAERWVIARVRRPLEVVERCRLALAIASEWNARARRSWFVASDGSYHRSEGDRRQHQQYLDDKAARYQRRVEAALQRAQDESREVA